MTAKGGALAVVIGRAGSKGLPGKNVRIVASRPIVYFTIRHAQAADTVDRVIVSSDSDAILAEARRLGASAVRRPEELATDTATIDSAVRHAIEHIEGPQKLVVILYANVPIRPPGLIDQAVRALIETGADSVQSYTDVGKHNPYWMATLDDAGRVRAYVRNTVYRRQDLPKFLIPDGGVIAVRRESLFTVVEGQPHAFLGTDRRGIQTEPFSVLDEDTAVDLALADSMLAGRASKAMVAGSEQLAEPPA